MTQRNIYIAAPAYTGHIRVETAQSLVEGMIDIAKHGWLATIRYTVGEPLHMTRNKYVVDFLRREEFTDLLFIDHDMQWEGGAVSKLMEHDVELVAGVYPFRRDPIAFAYRPLKGAEMQPNGLLEVEGVPGGFMRITRSCAQKMVDRYKHLQYLDDYIDTPVYELFGFETRRGRHFTEDFVFCNRWRDMGGQVWVDPSIKFAHVGHKSFIGRLSDTLAQADNVVPLTKEHTP